MGHKANICSLDFHPYGEFVASGSQDTNIKVRGRSMPRCLPLGLRQDRPGPQCWMPAEGTSSPFCSHIRTILGKVGGRHLPDVSAQNASLVSSFCACYCGE